MLNKNELLGSLQKEIQSKIEELDFYDLNQTNSKLSIIIDVLCNKIVDLQYEVNKLKDKK